LADLTRGSVCPVSLGRSGGHEQAGQRYAVVVQADELWLLSTVVVVPTSTSARPASFRPGIVIGDELTRVMCEQIRTVDARRLGEPVAMLSTRELREIEDAIEIVLGL
jgi:mRNA interferase MazF